HRVLRIADSLGVALRGATGVDHRVIRCAATVFGSQHRLPGRFATVGWALAADRDIADPIQHVARRGVSGGPLRADDCGNRSAGKGPRVRTAGQRHGLTSWFTPERLRSPQAGAFGWAEV